MAASERSPLLSEEDRQEDRPNNTETTPLLDNDQDRQSEGEGEEDENRTQTLWPQDEQADTKSGSKLRWASIIAAIVLGLLVVAVLLCGFLVPGAVKQYAEEAAVLEPTSLSVESITSDGVRARVQANFRLDGSKVDNVNAQRIGRIATGIMRKLETKETKVNVYMPHYNNSLLGYAVVPPITIDIVDGHYTEMDFVTEITPGNADDLRKIANNWLEGKLDQLKVTGSATVTVKSGIFPLGSHDVVESLVFEANKIPSVPDYKIERLSFNDVPMGRDGQKAVGANVSLSLHNDYPIGLNVPPLGFEILLANCDSSKPYISVAEAVTEVIEVHPDSDVHAGALGIIREIPKDLTRTCPKSNLSPLDHFMKQYLHGEDAQVFVRGNKIDDSDSPDWVTSILKSIMVPIELPGRSFGDAIRNFTATDVDFKLPSPFADPNDPDSAPRVSGTIQVLAALPDELNLDIGVTGIRSDADLYYEGDKLGELNMKDWRDAKSTKINVDNESLINITSQISEVPLDITNNTVFTTIIQKMLFGDDEDLLLDVKAAVDVEVGTVLGSLALKGIPANGTIPVKKLPRDTFTSFLPLVDEIQILNTSDTGVRMQARVNFTNPTPYTAFVPHLNVHLLDRGMLLGEAVATDINLKLGNNTGNIIEATWDPLKFGGKEAHEVGRRLLSKYVSGDNTTLEVRTHRGSVPSLPQLGEALSTLNLTIPTPRFGLPGDDGDDGDGDDKDSHGHFLRAATFHVFSSTAAFILASPLRYNTVYLEHINATAFYNHTEPIGQIISEDAFPATPGLSTTPRLPVTWSPSHIGYDKLKEALGGRLKLDAVADVRIRMGNWVEQVHYVGQGIGAKVSI